MTATDARYCRIPTNIIPRSGSVFLALNAGLKKAVLIDRPLADLLSRCRGFRTLEEHARAHVSGLPVVPDLPASAVGLDFVQQSLALLAAEGLLVSEDEWLREVGRQAGPDPIHAPDLTTVGIVTKNRPAYVERCLRSLTETLTEGTANYRICVYDDSDETTTLDAVRTICAGLHRHGGMIEYLGAAQRQRHLDRLYKTNHLSREVLDFGLSSLFRFLPGYGANLNWLLLNTVGSLALSVDDDIICRPGRTDFCTPGLALASPAREQYRFYESRGAAISSVEPSHANLISLHETLLGRSAQQCISGSKDGLNLTDIGEWLMTTVMNDEATIAATMLGIAGDSGTSGSWACLTGESRRRLQAAIRVCPSVIGSHEVVRAPCQLTITDEPQFMNYACGLDNRVLLPPFVPVCRNMDGVFATVLRCCFPNSLVGFLPWAVLHDPPVRDWRITMRLRPRISEILRMAVPFPAAEAHPSDPAANMIRVGRRLMDIGRLPMREFEAWLRLHYHAYLMTMLRQTDALSQEDVEAPKEWDEYCLDYTLALEGAISDADDVSAADLGGFGGYTEALGGTQTVIRLFGELLVSWRDIVQLSANVTAQTGSIADTITDEM
jgi:hypothetical protein